MAKTFNFYYDEKISSTDVLINKDGVYPTKLIKQTDNVSKNMIIYGDNLQILKSFNFLKEHQNLKGKIKLIYIDPPFATNNTFKSAEGAEAYSDKLDKVELLEFLRRRLIVARELLADDGSIYVHLDEKMSHYVKIAMDEIFGANSFQREIIWRMGWVSGYKSAAKNWIRNHDVIFYYTKKPKGFIFNKEYIPYPDDYKRRDGKKPTGKGIPIEDTWNSSKNDTMDSIQLMSFSGEKTGYPTQKNVNLLERIIRASTNEGDYVLDFFAGSGTTAEAAHNLNRNFIVCDFGRLAISKMKERFLRKGIDYNYYLANNFNLSDLKAFTDDEYMAFISQLYGFSDGQYKFDNEIKGFRDGNHIYYPKDSKILINEETLKAISEIINDEHIYIISPNSNIDVFTNPDDNFTLEYLGKKIHIFPLYLNENKYMDIEADTEEKTAVTMMSSTSISKNEDIVTKIKNDKIISVETSDGRSFDGLALIIFKSKRKIVKTIFSNEIKECISIPKEVDEIVLIDKLGNETSELLK